MELPKPRCTAAILRDARGPLLSRTCADPEFNVRSSTVFGTVAGMSTTARASAMACTVKGLTRWNGPRPRERRCRRPRAFFDVAWPRRPPGSPTGTPIARPNLRTSHLRAGAAFSLEVAPGRARGFQIPGAQEVDPQTGESLCGLQELPTCDSALQGPALDSLAPRRTPHASSDGEGCVRCGRHGSCLHERGWRVNSVASLPSSLVLAPAVTSRRPVGSRLGWNDAGP